MTDPKILLEQDQAANAKELAATLPPDDPQRREIEALTAHTDSPDAYRAYYQTMRGGVCPEAQVFRRHEQVTRFATIRRLILKRKHTTVLDLGCLDGWQLLNLAASGITGVGVDLCPEALAVARERAAKWGFPLTFIESAIENFQNEKHFDVVILSEVLEHVLDPVACLKVAANHLAPGGMVYLSVPATPIPHHGKLDDAREHLRVFSEQDLIDAARRAGLSVMIDHEVIPEQDSLTGEAFANRTISFRRATASIVCGHVTGGWDPREPESLGGSEELVVKVAESWARQGRAVTVYHNGPLTGEHHGVRYRQRSEAPPPNQDVLILYKTLDHADTPAGSTSFWTTDLPAPNEAASFLPPALAERFQAILCISEYQRTELLKACPWLRPDRVSAHWLGIDHPEIDRAVATSPKVPHRVLYASSYDRGLAHLLAIWPMIREQIPDAELHVTYGWDFWKKSEAVVAAPLAAQMRQERTRLEQALQQPGVVHRGRLSRAEYLRELAEAEVWAYPCTGGELCCKTALEAQAAHCIPVVVPTMALAETVQGGIRCSHETFAQQLITAVLDPDAARESHGTPTLPSWDALATWAWEHSTPTGTPPLAVQAPTVPVLDAETPLLPERFAIPTCSQTPPVRELSILMMVNGMPFDGRTDRERDLGGSETMAIQLSRALARRGHRVTVFSHLPARPGRFDGVAYMPIEEFGRYASTTAHDVTIMQRDPTGFNAPLASKLNLLWCHDLGLLRYHQSFRASLWNIDYVVPVSHWHGRQLCEVYGLPPELIAPMPNGIDLPYIQSSLTGHVVRDPHAVVYTSRPERGLDLLLSSIFPRLLERHPQLTLYVAGYDNTVQQLEGFYTQCRQAVAALGPRAKWLGPLKKAELYQLYARARVLCYPSRSFKEVSCVTAMEAAACGLPMVTTTLGALPETSSRVPGAARLVPHPGLEATPEFVSEYVEAASRVIGDDQTFRLMSEAGRQGATAYDWDGIAEQWESFLLGAIDARSRDALRLARHWWRLGDTHGVEQVLPELTPAQRAAFAPAEQVATLPPDTLFEPPSTLIHTIAQAVAQTKPTTVLALGPHGPSTAQTLASLLKAEAVEQGPADLVVGIETLDTADDPMEHLTYAQTLVAPGGHVCLVTAGQGMQEGRLHAGAHRGRRWVFDDHDLRDLLGTRPDMTVLTVGAGIASPYDGRALSWTLSLLTAGIPVGSLNLARRRWLQAPRLSLSACLIVKNGEDLLHRCLKSLAPYCDEIVVDDTGSTDSTGAILASYGVTPQPGLDPIAVGFDAARNHALARVTGDLVVWIDADEVLLDPQCLPKYLRWSMYDGFAIQQHHFSAVPPNAFPPDLPVRIFRRIGLNGKETGIRFIGRVHEHPETGLNQSVGQSVVLSDVHIGHDGYLTESTRRARFSRNIQLMFRDRAAYPDRMLGKFLMIRDWVHLARYEIESRGGMVTPDAAAYLEAAVTSYQRDFLGSAHQMAKDGLIYYNEALQLLRRGFETQIALKVGGLDGQVRELTYTGRMASPEDLRTLLSNGVETLTTACRGEYL